MSENHEGNRAQKGKCGDILSGVELYGQLQSTRSKTHTMSTKALPPSGAQSLPSLIQYVSCLSLVFSIFAPLRISSEPIVSCHRLTPFGHGLHCSALRNKRLICLSSYSFMSVTKLHVSLQFYLWLTSER